MFSRHRYLYIDNLTNFLISTIGDRDTIVSALIRSN